MKYYSTVGISFDKPVNKKVTLNPYNRAISDAVSNITRRVKMHSTPRRFSLKSWGRRARLIKDAKREVTDMYFGRDETLQIHDESVKRTRAQGKVYQFAKHYGYR